MSKKDCGCAYCNNGETGCGCAVYRMTPTPDKNLNAMNPTMSEYMEQKLSALGRPCSFTPLPPDRVYCMNAPWNSPQYFKFHRLNDAYGLVRDRPSYYYDFLQNEDS
jgi:hypothetical protein